MVPPAAAAGAAVGCSAGGAVGCSAGAACAAVGCSAGAACAAVGCGAGGAGVAAVVGAPPPQACNMGASAISSVSMLISLSRGICCSFPYWRGLEQVPWDALQPRFVEEPVPVECHQ